MKTITLAEYQGRCDEAGCALGHAPKVMSEYAWMVKESFDVQLFAPACVLKAAHPAGWEGAKILPHRIVMRSKTSLFEKIANKLRMFANIRLVLKNSEASEVWFFNTEFYLCLYLWLFGNGGKRIFFSTFKEDYKSGLFGPIKQWIFARAQRRMELILSAGAGYRFSHARSVFFPDYVCDEELYAPYRCKKRAHAAVCLGTMGAEKQLHELVACFTRIGMKLTIAGHFYDKDRRDQLRALAGENITICDEYLSRTEYLKLLGSVDFVVLPYAPGQYAKQTSGVLQEAVFLDTVVVSHAQVLAGNGIEGIGFESWEALGAEDFSGDLSTLREAYARLRQERYSRSYMTELLSEVLG